MGIEGPDLARAAAARTAAIAYKWDEQHPARAAEERALRRQRRQIRKEFGHKVHGTPETHFHASSLRQGAIARLYRSGALSIDELARAIEIASTARRISAEVSLRCVSLETRVDVSRHGDAFFEALGAVRREVAYRRWRAMLPEPRPVLAMVLDDIGATLAAKRTRMRRARAIMLLCEALELWGQLMADATRDIDEATLLAAQAGL